MPEAGDKFDTHVYSKWGEPKPTGKRETDSRNTILNDMYITIPQKSAKNFDIFMSNEIGANTEYEAFDEQGKKIATLKAQGCVKKGAVYAKQFSGTGKDNLTSLTPWAESNNIKDKDKIEVRFDSPTTLTLRKKDTDA
jgi:hypothetical protein